MEPEQLDKVGEFLVTNIRNGIIDAFDSFIDITSKRLCADRRFRSNVRSEFTREQLSLIRKIIIYCVDSNMTEFLYNLQKSNHESDVSICVDNRNVSEEEHFLQGMYFSDEGWIAKFSKHYDEDDV